MSCNVRMFLDNTGEEATGKGCEMSERRGGDARPLQTGVDGTEQLQRQVHRGYDRSIPAALRNSSTEDFRSLGTYCTTCWPVSTSLSTRRERSSFLPRDVMQWRCVCLSVSRSVCLSVLSKRLNLGARKQRNTMGFWDSSFLTPKICAKFRFGHLRLRRRIQVGYRLKSAIFDQYLTESQKQCNVGHSYYGRIIGTYNALCRIMLFSLTMSDPYYYPKPPHLLHCASPLLSS